MAATYGRLAECLLNRSEEGDESRSGIVQEAESTKQKARRGVSKIRKQFGDRGKNDRDCATTSSARPNQRRHIEDILANVRPIGCAGEELREPKTPRQNRVSLQASPY
jgi:hypothetical protein